MLRFGYAGKWSPDFAAIQQAAFLVKSSPVPVGVEAFPAAYPQYRVVTNQEYWQTAQNGRLAWTAIA